MSIDNSKWNERSANSTIKRDGSNGGIEKERRRKIAPLLSGFRKTRGKIKSSLCRACNKLFLIKQLFSFCLSNGYSLERFPYANKKIAAFFFQFSEGRRQGRVSASLEEMSNVSRRKRCGWRRNRLSFLSFLRRTEQRDWALTCHMSHSRRITSHKVTLPHLVSFLISHLFPDISNLRKVLLFWENPSNKETSRCTLDFYGTVP